MKNLIFIIFAGFLATASFAQQTDAAPATATPTVKNCPDMKAGKACAEMKDGKACAGMKDGKACAGMTEGKACCAAKAGATGSTDKGMDNMVKKTAVASTNGLESATFKVNGVCGMCKRTIEKGAKAGGAATAEWDADTHVMVITYDSKTANLDAIHKSIAATGYDTEKVKADDGTYKKLHGCCQYDRKSL